MSARHNMYGFTPCPKCNQPYRFTVNTDVRTVLCDDCGHKEPVSVENSADWYREDLDERVEQP